MTMWQMFTAQLISVLTLGFGALLISLFPIITKHNRSFGYFSLIMGIIMWLLLVFFVLMDNFSRNGYFFRFFI